MVQSEAVDKLALLIALAAAKFLVRVIVGPAAKEADAWFCCHGRVMLHIDLVGLYGAPATYANAMGGSFGFGI
ncbi:hypothetical protein U1Q18_012431 [Sarracenia purpurea var. burkii]